MYLLTSKPVLYIANVSESQIENAENDEKVKQVEEFAKTEGAKVIPLCVDYSNILTSKISKAEACKKLNINPDAAIIGIVGRIDKLKVQHFLIEAVQKLRQNSFNIELLIAGEPTREP